MELKVTQEPLENCQIELTAEIDQARIDQELKKAAKQLSRQYQFPGFRKGKAPYSVVVQHVGLEALYTEFVDDLGQEVYKQIVEDEHVEPYATASLVNIEFDPLRFIFHVPLEPEIDLGNYRDLRVEKEVTEVTNEDIEARIEQYQAQYAEWQEVDRPSQYGDLMTVDVRGVLTEPDEGDEETVVLDETEWEVTPDEDNPMDPPGFDEQLLGLNAGDEKTFTLSWPEDEPSIYAGKSAEFKVKVHSIQAYLNAELTDELAQTIGPDFETVDDLRNSVKETLEEEAEQKAEDEYLDKAFEVFVEQAEMTYPPVVIEDQLDAMMNDYESQLRRYGIEDFESYLENVGLTRDGLRDSQREDAVSIAERNLILSELIQLEGLVATDEDVDEHINSMLGDVSDDKENGGAEPLVEEEGDEEGSSIAFDNEPSQAVEGEVESIETEQDVSAEEVANEETSERDQYRQNMVEMFRDGPGRSIIESQILTQKATERLLAIVRGDELPEPTPLTREEEEDAAADVSESDPDESSPEQEVISEA